MSDTSEFMKEVKFEKFCNRCYYGRLPEFYDPCNTCLDDGAREGTCVPTNFKKWDKKSKRPTAVKKPAPKPMGKIEVEDL